MILWIWKSIIKELKSCSIIWQILQHRLQKVRNKKLNRVLSKVGEISAITIFDLLSKPDYLQKIINISVWELYTTIQQISPITPSKLPQSPTIKFTLESPSQVTNMKTLFVSNPLSKNHLPSVRSPYASNWPSFRNLKSMSSNIRT